MNAHNEQHDPASPVVKQNLTTQPAAAQEAVGWQWRWLDTDNTWSEWVDGGSRKEIDARIARWKADGEDHRMQVRPLFAAPVTAAPADTWFADQLAAMGEVIPLDSTPAAPGIDLRPQFEAWLDSLRLDRSRDGDEYVWNDVELAWRAVQEFGAGIDASPKGDDVADTLRLLLDERNHRTDGDLRTLAARCLHLSRGDRDLIAMRGALIEKLQQRIAKDSPKGGSEALDAARYRYHRDRGITFVERNDYCAYRVTKTGDAADTATDAAMQAQAGDAEVQPLCDLCRKRPEAHSDAEGIGFCEVCWGEWVEANSHGAGVSP
ncbi:hypothetical protein ACO0J1_13580 [Stenotrophomonas acidaminiphila]|uniref:hypothetical protein n=1 Tax=Stenotrophomonas acidaminiphila TaxID=128780 RepID=UPI003BF22137